ncbi:hypothetical protein OIU76_021546 [Salix suchowensis]|nr:hypothetical protein OIU76_021546 [Salix suchowensis]
MVFEKIRKQRTGIFSRLVQNDAVIRESPSSEQTAASSSGDFAWCLSRSLASCIRVLAQREPPRQPFPEKQHFDMEDLDSSKPDNIVHGDLQSQNILLNSELSSEICEFGIRRLVTA